jgi:hypothetical protein
MKDVPDVYHRAHDQKFAVVAWTRNRCSSSPTRVRRCRPARGRARRRDHEYRRNGTANVFCAFEPLGNWRKLDVTDRRKRADWARFARGLIDAPR